MSLFNGNFEDSSIWSMKYRPSTIQECVLPKQTKDQFIGILASGKIPNLILASSTPGTGKTTSCLALCKQLGYDVLFLNASLDNSIDQMRTTITGFCSSVSLDDRPKVVFLDEADGLSQQAMASLRGVIEQHSNVSFVLTCNYVQKLIEPIRSRCAVIEFKIPDEDRKDVLKQFLTRVFHILDKESVEYDKRVIVEFVTKYFPDFRKVLNELQRYASGGPIDSGVLSSVSDAKVDTLIAAIRDREFSTARKWIGENTIDHATFYGKLYDEMYEKLEPSSIPPVILILAKYQHMSSMVADQQLNLAAAVVELMSESSFK